VRRLKTKAGSRRLREHLKAKKLQNGMREASGMPPSWPRCEGKGMKNEREQKVIYLKGEKDRSHTVATIT